MVENKNIKIERAPEVRVNPSEYEQSSEIGVAELSFNEKKEAVSVSDPLKSLSASPADQSLSPMVAAYRQVESILEDGLTDVYFTLPPAKQKEFKIKGEKTAAAILKIVGRSKIKVKKIIGLIITWLKIIPGINRFFLEQEAKIKTDRILEAMAEGRQKIIR